MSALDDILAAIDDYIDDIDPTTPRPGLAKFSLLRANLAAIKNATVQVRAAFAYISEYTLNALILTGVDFVTSTAITATDSALVAFGKLQAQITLRAPLDSPALTGIPTAPTATPGTDTTQISTTAFVAQAIADLVASSPAALDTLNELAAALGNDANFAATVTAALAGKQATLTLTTTGSSGAATLTGGALNIPQYSGGGGGGGLTVWPLHEQVTGAVPTLVGSLRLPAGTYTPSAMLGSGQPANATSLVIKEGSTTLKTLGGVAGGLSWQTATSFTLASTADIDLYLFCNSSTDNAYLRALELS
jgi:hypothetical protein